MLTYKTWLPCKRRCTICKCRHSDSYIPFLSSELDTMTLTYKHDPWPKYSGDVPAYQKWSLSIRHKTFESQSTNRTDRQTHTHTHRQTRPNLLPQRYSRVVNFTDLQATTGSTTGRAVQTSSGWKVRVMKLLRPSLSDTFRTVKRA